MYFFRTWLSYTFNTPTCPSSLTNVSHTSRGVYQGKMPPLSPLGGIRYVGPWHVGETYHEEGIIGRKGKSTYKEEKQTIRWKLTLTVQKKSKLDKGVQHEKWTLVYGGRGKIFFFLGRGIPTLSSLYTYYPRKGKGGGVRKGEYRDTCLTLYYQHFPIQRHIPVGTYRRCSGYVSTPNPLLWSFPDPDSFMDCYGPRSFLSSSTIMLSKWYEEVFFS